MGDTKEQEQDAAKLDALFWVLEKSGKLEEFKTKFGITKLQQTVDRMEKLLQAIQKGLEDE